MARADLSGGMPSLMQAFKDLGLKWAAVPSLPQLSSVPGACPAATAGGRTISNFNMRLGGVDYPCCPLLGSWAHSPAGPTDIQPVHC